MPILTILTFYVFVISNLYVIIFIYQSILFYVVEMHPYCF